MLMEILPLIDTTMSDACPAFITPFTGSKKYPSL